MKNVALIIHTPNVAAYGIAGPQTEEDARRWLQLHSPSTILPGKWPTHSLGVPREPIMRH